MRRASAEQTKIFFALLTSMPGIGVLSAPADLHDPQALAAVFAQYRPVAVMHFAALSLVGESVVDPEKHYVNNVGGTLSLLRAMRIADCSRLVFSSSGAVYGQAGRDPIRED